MSAALSATVATASAPAAARRASALRNPAYWVWASVALALALVYAPVVVTLVGEWFTNPNYSHGILIPFAVAFFVWHQRADLRALPRRPSSWGLVLAVYSQIQYLIGVLGAEYFLQRTSLLVLVAGALVYVHGWRLLRTQLFSLLLLLLAIPLPKLVFNAITFPLQLLASAWAASLLWLCGIPVFRSGNILELPQRTLDVAEACSGIRSLFSLIALAMMVAYFLPSRLWVKIALVLSAVPIALAANAVRIMASGLLGRWFGPQASEGFFHAFSGWCIFLVAFAALLLEARLLSRWLPARRGRSAPEAA